MQIQCIKVIPYIFNDQLLLDTEQIIPVKDVADITISLEDKAQDEIATGAEIAQRELIRDKFWKELLPKFNAKSNLFSGINTESSHYDHWLSTGAGVSGLSYSFVITKKYVAVELSISKPSSEDNKLIFDTLCNNKSKIEETFGNQLSWQRLDDKKMSRITYIHEGVSVFNEEEWETMQDFLIQNMIKLSDTFKGYISKIKTAI